MPRFKILLFNAEWGRVLSPMDSQGLARSQLCLRPQRGGDYDRWWLEPAGAEEPFRDWWVIRNKSGRSILTLGREENGVHRVTLEAQPDTLDDEHKWFLERREQPEPLPGQRPFLPDRVRLWSRRSRDGRAVLTTDCPRDEGVALIARDNVSEGRQSHWFPLLIDNEEDA